MPLISLDPDQADQCAARFATAQQELTDRLNQMSSASETLLATWRGQSSSRYAATWASQQQRIQAILTDLNYLSQGLRTEAEEFRQADQMYGA